MSYIPLSEHILLGDSLRSRNAETFLAKSPKGRFCGCATGGALLSAMGEKGINFNYPISVQVLNQWPWLWKRDRSNRGLYFNLITDMFFEVVDGKLTLEQLVDKVREWELLEDEKLQPQAEPLTKEEVCV